MTSARRTTFKGVAMAVLTLAASATMAMAHDFWIVPNAFAVAPGGSITVSGQTSSLFPTSLSAVTPDRVVSARVISADTTVHVRNASVSGTSMRLVYRPPANGQYVIGVQLAPRNVRESPESFKRYLDLEGAPEARIRYEKAGLLPAAAGDSITRRYAKYAKTLIEVGRGARAYTQSADHPLEFMPLDDPSTLKVGDTLRVRMMLLGKPVADAKLHAGSVALNAQTLRDTTSARQASKLDVKLETDGQGIAAFVLSRAGLWNVRTLQIIPAVKGSGADWDVHWATLVFSVQSR